MQGVYEVMYLHTRWPRPRPLAKLRGTHLTALAWPPQPAPINASGDGLMGVTQPPSKQVAGSDTSPALSETCTGWVRDTTC